MILGDSSHTFGMTALVDYSILKLNYFVVMIKGFNPKGQLVSGCAFGASLCPKVLL